MRSAFFVCLLVCLVASAVARVEETLPSGFRNAEEIARVLANEPASALSAAIPSAGGPSSVAFQDLGSNAPANDGTPPNSELAEFDNRINKINEDAKTIQAQIKQAETCANKLKELEARRKALDEQKETIEREKQKKILEGKLDKQTKDLSAIARMAARLRAKFEELRRTESIIKNKIRGTKHALDGLEDDAGYIPEEGAQDALKELGEVLDPLHTAQKRSLKRTHTIVKRDLQQFAESNEKMQNSS